MVDPIDSRYYPRPAEGGGGDAPGTDADAPSYTATDVPGLTMNWNSWDDVPSFNTDPAGAGGDGDSVVRGTPLNEQPLVVNPISMRATERDMLSAIDRGVEAYTALKAKVEAAIAGGSLYGQTDTDQTYVDTTTLGGQSSGYWRTDPSPLQGAARDFAEQMEDFQRGALIGVAAALDVAGSYIAALNNAGTTYSYIDRHSKFPEPPAAPAGYSG